MLQCTPKIELCVFLHIFFFIIISILIECTDYTISTRNMLATIKIISETSCMDNVLPSPHVLYSSPAVTCVFGSPILPYQELT